MNSYGNAAARSCTLRRKLERIKESKTLTTLLITLSLAGCYKADIPSTVVLLGDSLMQETSGGLAFQMLHNDSAPMLINNSMGGMMLAALEADRYWGPRLNNIRAEADVDYVFVSLGINDINFYRQRPDGINEMLAEVPQAIDNIARAARGTEVYWLVPHLALQDSKVAGPEVDLMRELLAQASRRWDNLNLIYIGNDHSLFEKDIIHLSGKGQQYVTEEFLSKIGEQR